MIVHNYETFAICAEGFIDSALPPPPPLSGDIVDDAIYNFSRVYQQYAQQGDASEDEREMAEKPGTCGLSASDEDRCTATTPGGSGKKTSPKAKKQKGFEKVNLLVGSDEEEIF
jgi:hypothetical protein